MICPKCNSSEMWDNRPKKATGEFSAKSPDFKCKDKNCDGVVWPEKPNAPKTAVPYKPRVLPSDPGRLSDKDRAFGQAKGASFNKACDLVIAGFNKDLFTYEEIPQRVEEMFQALVKINAGDDVA